MELTARAISVQGAHAPMLRPTSLHVGDHQLLLLAGDPGAGHTAASLALSGRLRPDGGEVKLDGSADEATLRRLVAVVDTPGITEPDDPLPVRTVVGEELAVAGRKAGRRAVQDWLAGHDAAEYGELRFEQLPVEARTRLLVELTVERPEVKLLVLTMPDRFGGPAPLVRHRPGPGVPRLRGRHHLFGGLRPVARRTGRAARIAGPARTRPGRRSRARRTSRTHRRGSEGSGMTPLRIALSELRRLTAGRLPKLAVVALLCIPMLYGGLYLYANHDPYGRLDKVPAAVVVEDAGTTLSTGEKLAVGPRVADELVSSRSFGWHRVDRAEATAGVADGRYAFALVLPKSFSADLASSAEFRPRQAMLELTTNDANNYLARTIANQVVAQVTKSVAAEVSSTAASKLLAGFSTIHGQVLQAEKGAGRLKSGLTSASDGVTQLKTGATQLNTAQKQLSAGATKLSTGTNQAAKGAGDLASGATELSNGLGTLRTRTSSLPAQTRSLANGADQVADGNEQIATAGREVATASSTLLTNLSTVDSTLAARLRAAGFTPAQVNQVLAETARLRAPVVTANTKIQSTSQQLTKLATGARQVSNGAAALADSTPALTQGIGTAAAGATKLTTGATQLKTGLGTLQTGAAQLAAGERQAVTGQGQLLTGITNLQTGLGKLKTGASQLDTALANGAKQIPDPSPASRRAIAQTLGAPVTVTDTSQATANSYGAGLAPFFLSLACWIGAYVLFLLVRPLSPRALAALQSPLRVALGGWLVPALFGAIQAALVFTLVVVGIGIDAAHPWLTLLFLIFTSMTFVAIVHALSAWLGAVGKFLGLVLLVVQLVSGGGTFPWQTIPTPLYFFHHALPMSYAIDGVRHLMYGGPNASVGLDLAVLAAWLLAALTASALAARKQRVWTAGSLQPELVL